MGGTGATYQVRIEDNVDEMPPATNNPLADTDGTVLMVSVCNAGTPDEQVARQYLTMTPIVPTGFVYTTTDDRVDRLPRRASGSATLQGRATLTTTGAGAPAGLRPEAAALALNGVDGAALFQNADALNGTLAIEVALWFRADPAQRAHATLLSKAHGAVSGNTGWSVEFDSAGRHVRFGLFTDNHTGGIGVFSATPLNDGRWHYLVGRYDRQRVALYVDSVLQG